MRHITPLLALLFLSLPASSLHSEGMFTPPMFDLSPAPALDKALEKEIPFKPDKKLAMLALKQGFTLDEKAVFTHDKSGVKIHREMLKKAGLDFDKEGRLVYKKEYEPDAESALVDEKHVPGILNGLLPFARVAAYDPKEVGKKLQAWGLPVAFDGIHLLNPDGSATYYGRMLYEGLKDQPEGRLKNLSGKRLAQSFTLFDRAFGQVFGTPGEPAPDVANADLQRAWNILALDLRSGEMPLKLKGYADIGGQFKDHRKGLEAQAVAAGQAGDGKKKAELDQYIATLNAVENKRYYKNKDLGQMKPPPSVDAAPGKNGGPMKPVSPVGMGEVEPPALKHRFLPGLLQALDKFGGKPLTAQQQEALVKSFPMGETIWRMNAPELWRQGLTGKGVKVAVIDTGVGKNPELEGVVKERKNYTDQRGRSAYGEHGTHVAGTIHALAPNAEINSYRAVSENDFKENSRLSPQDGYTIKARIMQAIDDAVKDGNHIINMSLGSDEGPTGPLVKKVEEYAKKGVIFVIAAGNNGWSGVQSPSTAANALTVGALDADGRMTTFSTFGSKWDPSKMSYVVKKVLMAPGKNIVSTTAVGGDDKEYRKMDGTSMTTPHVTGSAALLTGYMLDMNKKMNPFTMSRKVEKALIDSAKPMDYNKLSPDVSIDQDFIVVDPAEAYKKLRGDS